MSQATAQATLNPVPLSRALHTLGLALLGAGAVLVQHAAQPLGGPTSAPDEDPELLGSCAVVAQGMRDEADAMRDADRLGGDDPRVVEAEARLAPGRAQRPALIAAIAARPSRTHAGLRAKARLINSLVGHDLAGNPVGTPFDLLVASATRDMLALT